MYVDEGTRFLWKRRRYCHSKGPFFRIKIKNNSSWCPCYNLAQPIHNVLDHTTWHRAPIGQHTLMRAYAAFDHNVLHSITICKTHVCAHEANAPQRKFVVVLVRRGDVEHREDHEQSFNVVEARLDAELERDVLQQLNAKKRRRKVICNTCAEARDTGNNKTSDFTSKYAIITANQARGSGARAEHIRSRNRQAQENQATAARSHRLLLPMTLDHFNESTDEEAALLKDGTWKSRRHVVVIVRAALPTRMGAHPPCHLRPQNLETDCVS